MLTHLTAHKDYARTGDPQISMGDESLRNCFLRPLHPFLAAIVGRIQGDAPWPPCPACLETIRIPMTCGDIERVMAIGAEEGRRFYRTRSPLATADDPDQAPCPDDVLLDCTPEMNDFLWRTRTEYGEEVIMVRAVKALRLITTSAGAGWRMAALTVSQT